MFAKVKDRLDAGMRAAVGAGSAPLGADGTMPSIIGPDMRISGDLSTPGEVHVEGRIDGDVACARLTVGPSGHIAGHVTAGAVRVHGRVDGSITGDEVYLQNGSFVSGDIVQALLEIAPGAQFEGAVRRKAGATVALPAAVQPPAATPQPAIAAPPADPAPAAVSAPDEPFRLSKPLEEEPLALETPAEEPPAPQARPREENRHNGRHHHKRRDEHQPAAGR
ncbi:MAG TPA: polymer-forming cytoskeletal protein [Azospirillaceae bacterium]|nr:polymer-forming cytoskeletal protein [Azospirillaceae bacterium]